MMAAEVQERDVSIDQTRSALIMKAKDSLPKIVYIVMHGQSIPKTRPFRHAQVQLFSYNLCEIDDMLTCSNRHPK